MRELCIALAAVVTAAACGVEETGVPPPADELYYPVGIAAHPDGRYLYVSNAVFDRRFNAGTLTVYDTFQRRILPDATVRVGLFASEVFVGRPILGGAPADAVLAFLGTRDDDNLNVIAIDAARGDDPRHLNCSQSSDSTCQSPSVIGRLLGATGQPSVFDDPYGLAIGDESLVVSHVGRGVVSKWRIESPDDEGRQPPPTGQCSLNLEGGASSVAIHPQVQWIYVSDRAGQIIETIEVVPPDDRGVRGVDLTDGCRMVTRDRIIVDPISTRGRTRGLAFSADGTLLYVASSSDAALKIYDASVGPGGRPWNRLVQTIPLGNGPNVVRVAGLRPGESMASTTFDRGAVGRAVDDKGGGLVYVTSFDDDRLIVVDPTLLAVIARVEVGDGPHDIAFLPDGAGQMRAYVSLFADNALAVVDIEPNSPTRFQRLATVP